MLRSLVSRIVPPKGGAGLDLIPICLSLTPNPETEMSPPSGLLLVSAQVGGAGSGLTPPLDFLFFIEEYSPISASHTDMDLQKKKM